MLSFQCAWPVQYSELHAAKTFIKWPENTDCNNSYTVTTEISHLQIS